VLQKRSAVGWVIILSFGLAAPIHAQTIDLFGAPAHAATPSTSTADAPFWATTRRLTYGIQVVYGLENGIPRNISHVNMLYAAPQVGAIVWDSPHSRLPVNRFEIISEGILGSAFHPGGVLLGDTLLFRFDFKPIRKVVPMFDAGIGALHTTLDTRAPEITGHTQFLSQGGVGLQYFFKPRRAIVFEYRYFHMSNAGLEQPNHGFNGSMLSIGYRWLLR
jgi:Lipid A 3-O-deacylase (PagL)